MNYTLFARYVTAGQIPAAGQRVQSGTAFEPHAVYADEPSSGRHDEPEYAAARNARRTARRRWCFSGRSGGGIDEKSAGYGIEYGRDNQVSATAGMEWCDFGRNNTIAFGEIQIQMDTCVIFTLGDVRFKLVFGCTLWLN